MKPRRQKLEEVEIGEDGFPMCRFCKKPVGPPRRTFCSPTCVHEYRVRSDTNYVRQCLLFRDKGVCKGCKTDTVKLVKDLIALEKQETFAAFKALLEENGLTYAIFRSRTKKKRYGIWDADHRTEVADGGGLSGLDNFDTLCYRCHKAKTKASAAERRQKKVASSE